MKNLLPIQWMLASVPVITVVIAGFGYPIGNALALAVTFLPAMLAARYFIPQLDFTDRWRGIHDAAFLVSAILVLEYLLIILTDRYIIDYYTTTNASTLVTAPDMPTIIYNPFFLLLMLAAFTFAGMRIERYAAQRQTADDKITFISDRRHITLAPAEIIYVESNNSEVWIRTASGEDYRTRARISQWESQLDSRFLRIHRSFIINTMHITEQHAARIVIGGRSIDISRKYKDEVRRRLRPDRQTDGEAPDGNMNGTIG